MLFLTMMFLPSLLLLQAQAVSSATPTVYVARFRLGHGSGGGGGPELAGVDLVADGVFRERALPEARVQEQAAALEAAGPPRARLQAPQPGEVPRFLPSI